MFALHTQHQLINGIPPLTRLPMIKFLFSIAAHTRDGTFLGTCTKQRHLQGKGFPASISQMFIIRLKTKFTIAIPYPVSASSKRHIINPLKNPPPPSPNHENYKQTSYSNSRASRPLLPSPWKTEASLFLAIKYRSGYNSLRMVHI